MLKVLTTALSSVVCVFTLFVKGHTSFGRKPGTERQKMIDTVYMTKYYNGNKLNGAWTGLGY